MLRPPELRTYHGRSTQDHRDWFRDCEDAIDASLLYFPTDTSKVQYALRFLDAEPKASWRSHIGDTPKESWTWEGFESFLLDRIEDPQNRHLAISKSYADARQKPG